VHSGSGKRVLLVDDDRELVEMLRLALTQDGYQVTAAHNGREGIRAFYELKPDLVILDLMMPAMDGWEVCERIRELSDTPLLILTARSAESDIARGLYLGADDYITKPFGISEFLARVRAVMRRSEEMAHLPTHSLLTIDRHLSIDMSKRRVIVNGRPGGTLSPTELRLLAILVANAGDVVPSEVLLERVWGGDKARNVGHLKTYIHYLRNKIEPDPENPRYIATERGLGYRFRVPE
jgi:DNA-binding response OmpR family regulator